VCIFFVVLLTTHPSTPAFFTRAQALQEQELVQYIRQLELEEKAARQQSRAHALEANRQLVGVAFSWVEDTHLS
jgi:hypothetical protein